MRAWHLAKFLSSHEPALNLTTSQYLLFPRGEEILQCDNS